MELEPNQPDEFCLRLLSDTNTADARKWLREGKRSREFRTLGELESTDDSLALVDEIYAAGALAVKAVAIDVSELGQNTDKLVIELPANGQWRERCFELECVIAKEQGFDPTPDVGQKYLFLWLD